MGNYTEKEIIENFYDLDNRKMFILLMNYFSEMKDIKADMVRALDLLDELADNPTKNKKEKLRKLILDNFNQLPRSTKNMYGELYKILKEE